jgi:hypothetical protein
MSRPDREAMLDRDCVDLSMRRQCTLLRLARSGVYRRKAGPDPDDLAVMKRIDELHLAQPFYGSRKMVVALREEGRQVNRKRVRRLMRIMGLEALVPKPRDEHGFAAEQDLSLSAARHDDRPAQPRVGRGHHVYSDGEGLSLSRGDHRLGEPGGARMAAVEYDGHEVLPGGP